MIEINKHFWEGEIMVKKIDTAKALMYDIDTMETYRLEGI